MARILVIEDDYTQLDIIEQGLAFHGHVIDTKGDGAEGLEQLLAHHYDLAIIDWDLPGLQGVDVCNKYRNSGGTAAVLFLTGKSSVTNKVQAFDCGADDYLTKPFSYAELLARVKALLRRPHTMESESLVYQEITLDMVTKVATVSGKDANGHYKSTEWTTSWSLKDKTYFCVVLDITEKVAAENLKKDMLAMISHDLRTPLSSLKLILECAGQGVYGTLSDRGISTMKNAQQSSDYLINMINDLLDVENFEAGGLTLDIESHPVSSIIHIARDMVEPNAEKKQIKLDVQLQSFDVRADGERINRTLVNLLGNAVKFAPDKSTITLAANPSQDGKWAEFSIRDEGPGIPPEKIELVFEKYRQVGTRSEGEKKGSGLGLAICKALVEAHGGNIGVRNLEPKGCEFWLKIPINGKTS